MYQIHHTITYFYFPCQTSLLAMNGKSLLIERIFLAKVMLLFFIIATEQRHSMPMRGFLLQAIPTSNDLTNEKFHYQYLPFHYQ